MLRTTKTPVVLSYSGGASSEWALQAVVHGLIKRPEHFAVAMADTGEEHDWTYERAEYVKGVCVREGIEFLSCSDGKQSLGDHLLSLAGKTRADQPPLWIKTGTHTAGRTENRCTGRWKIAPMRREVSKWLKRIRQPKAVEKWIGFGHDEMSRATKAIAKAQKDVKWERLAFPAIAAGRTRGEQRADLMKWVGSAPDFSMCTLCPHKSTARWLATPRPALARVYQIDAAIRNMDEQGLTDGKRS